MEHLFPPCEIHIELPIHSQQTGHGRMLLSTQQKQMKEYTAGQDNLTVLHDCMDRGYQ